MTAALPLRVVVGAYELIEGASLYKTIQPPCGRWKCPLGAVRYQRGESHRRWLITVMLFMPYDTESQSRNADFICIAAERQSATLGAKGPVKLKNPPA